MARLCPGPCPLPTRSPGRLLPPPPTGQPPPWSAGMGCFDGLTGLTRHLAGTPPGDSWGRGGEKQPGFLEERRAPSPPLGRRVLDGAL